MRESVTTYSWIVDRDENVHYLERCDRLTKALSYAHVLENGTLEETFHDENGMVTGIVPKKYVTAYRKHIKKKKVVTPDQH